MSMEQFSSALAPAIRDLILFKRECGAVYKHGEVLLGQFDRFCRKLIPHSVIHPIFSNSLIFCQRQNYLHFLRR